MTLLDGLRGGDRRSIGLSDEEAAAQVIADLAMQEDSLPHDILPLLEELTRDGTPAMQNRGRKLLKRLNE